MTKAQQKVKNKRLVTEQYLDLRLGIFKGEMKGEIIEEMKEEMRAHTAQILQGVDKIITRFDAAEKDHAAHAMLHTRITDDLHGHDVRIKKLEARI